MDDFTNNERELLARVAQRDPDAMLVIYDQLSGIVYSVALQVLRDPSESEDVTQEVFLQLWRTPERFDVDRGPLRNWLVIVARNRAIDALRRKKPQNGEATELEDPNSGNGHAEGTHLLCELHDRIAQMPERQRTCFQLAYVQGLSHSEISERTGEPLGTVKSRIRSGLEYLRSKMLKQDAA
jgi:RNA polymerase sigma-70 factor, ECF subfamily